ncbi:unnamed protein product [Cuscuta epithymum]|uniref:Uncharacterized protein n=1 Tax=Cuscuta epithymum TaxID=186058 RepID=A0AAV0CTW3_9ASTE|nr:unnamed protein product [Cuscuta epithymum]
MEDFDMTPQMEKSFDNMDRMMKETNARLKTMMADMQASFADMINKLQRRSPNRSHTSRRSHRDPHHSSRKTDRSRSRSHTSAASPRSSASHRPSHNHQSRHSASPEESEDVRHRRKSCDRTVSSPSSSQRSSQSSSHHSYHRSLHQISSKDSHSSHSSSKVTSRNSDSSKKEKLPLFYEEEAYEWIEKMERYFRVQVIAERFKVDVAAKAMGEAADDWFQWWNFQKREDSWEALKEDLVKDFPPKHRQKTGRAERKESSRARRTSSSPHSRTSSFSLQESSLSRQRKQESSRSSRTSRSQVYQSAPEISKSTKKTQMEPTEPVIKQVNKKDEIKEKRQDIHGPDYVYSNLAEGVDLTSNQVSIADKLIQPCSFGNRALIVSETVLVKSQLCLQPKERLSEKLCVGKNKSGTEAQEKEVGLVSGEIAIIQGNRTQINAADKYNHGQHLELQQAELQPGVESMLDYLKPDLHNSFRVHEGYLLLGDISAMTTHNLLLPGVYESFTRFLQRLTPKTYQQILAIRTTGVKSLSIDDIKIVREVSGDPNNRKIIQSKKQELWKWRGTPMVKETEEVNFAKGCWIVSEPRETSLRISSTAGSFANGVGDTPQENKEICVAVEGLKTKEENENSSKILYAAVKSMQWKNQVWRLFFQKSVRYWEGRSARKRKRKQKIVAVSYNPP